MRGREEAEGSLHPQGQSVIISDGWCCALSLCGFHGVNGLRLTFLGGCLFFVNV